MAQFDRSGLSGPAFCKVAGINYQTFAGWRKEARRKPALAMSEATCHDKEPALVRFVEAALPMPPACTRPDCSLHVRLPGGAALTLADVAQVPLFAQIPLVRSVAARSDSWIDQVVKSAVSGERIGHIKGAEARSIQCDGGERCPVDQIG